MSKPPCSVIAQPELAAGLRRLGLAGGQVALAHSSLSAFGWVEGGAEAVIRALLEVLGPEGTLVLPTLCQRDGPRRFETWDLVRSPSDVGQITEVFRHWPGVVRSDHATHSVAALGLLAREITSGHGQAHGRPGPWGPAAFGHGSPWEQLYRLNARYCFLGVTFRVNTMRHFVQSLLLEEILVSVSAQRRAAVAAQVAGWNKPGLWPNWDAETMEKHLAERGLICYAAIGQATCRALPARTLVDEILAALKGEPERWLDEAFCKWWRGLRGD